MSSAANETQHQCSCGRTFRHGISLKRHQKVSGCVEAEVSAVEAAAAASPAPVAPAAGKLAPMAGPQIIGRDDDESGSVVITAQQIARWQEQKNFRPAAPAVEAKPALDWDALRATGEEFASFAAEQFSVLGRFCGSVVQLGARFTLFGGFLIGLGWLLLFGVSQGLSAAPASALDRAEAAEMAARSTVTSFLQTAQLAQFERARNFLSSKTRSTVSAGDLRSMFASLSLEHAPDSVTSTLERDGRVARVTVVRGATAEVYTLVQEAQGWGLASVAVRRS